MSRRIARIVCIVSNRSGIQYSFLHERGCPNHTPSRGLRVAPDERTIAATIMGQEVSMMIVNEH